MSATFTSVAAFIQHVNGGGRATKEAAVEAAFREHGPMTHLECTNILALASQYCPLMRNGKYRSTNIESACSTLAKKGILGNYGNTKSNLGGKEAYIWGLRKEHGYPAWEPEDALEIRHLNQRGSYKVPFAMLANASDETIVTEVRTMIGQCKRDRVAMVAARVRKAERALQGKPLEPAALHP